MNTTTMERPPLVQVIGTVIGITPAPAANRSGKIKLDDGKILSAFPDKLQHVYEGHTYDFGCVETNKAGVIYRDVKAVRPAAQQPQRQAPVAPPRAQASQVRPAPAQRSEPIEPPRHEPQRQPQNGNGGGYYKSTDPRDAKRMWMCSQLNALITSRQVVISTDGITEANRMLSEAYDVTIGQEDTAG